LEARRGSIAPEVPANHPTGAIGHSLRLPIVFLCAQCRLPAGDSLAWSGWDSAERVICLKSHATNVSPLLSPASIYVLLTCSGCAMILGKKYVCTPIHLDFRRNLYCLYVHGSEEARLVNAGRSAVIQQQQQIIFAQRRARQEDIPRRWTVRDLDSSWGLVSGWRAEVGGCPKARSKRRVLRLALMEAREGVRQRDWDGVPKGGGLKAEGPITDGGVGRAGDLEQVGAISQEDAV
uniref:Protein Mis18-alpha n=1 Tax=Callorhinchus milii TaxID=7868 RepID=A0A4W3JRG6_CALMI